MRSRRLAITFAKYTPLLVGTTDSPRDAQEAVAHGKGHLIRGETDLALAAFNEASDLDPGNADARFERGRIYINQRQYEDAIADYDVVLGLQPDNGPAYFNRGLAHEFLGLLAEAVADYTADIAIRPNNRDTYYRRGRISARGKDFAAAAADYSIILEIQAFDVPALRGRGYASFNLGDFALTEHDFGLAVRDSMSSPEARLFAAIWSFAAAVRQGKDGGGALEEMILGISEDHNRFRAEPVDVLADVWPGPVAALYLGRIGTEELMAHAVDTESQSRTERLAEITFYLGEFYLARGDGGAARAQFEQTIVTGVTNYVEFDGAVAELARIGP